MPGMPRVIVVGGSIGGLTAALVLRDAGCDVRVFERSSTALTARGAGIAALDTTLEYLVRRGGFRACELCSATDWIRFLNRDGSVRHEQRHRYLFSSWNTIYRSLLGLFDAGRYLLGTEVTGFRQDGDTVTVTLASGAAGRGRPSGLRGRGWLTRPGAAGARRRPVVLRATWPGAATVPERDLSAGTRARLGDALTYQVLPGSHILVYPIPALDGSLSEGDRLINTVWYVNVAEGAPLDALMTGRDGIRRPVSMPPGAATGQAVTGMRQAAADLLAPPIAEVIARTAEPFVQVVYDIEVPRMAFGRTCLLGDAAFAVRPHAAAGHGQGRRRRLGAGTGARGRGRRCPGRARAPGNAASWRSAAACWPAAGTSATPRSSPGRFRPGDPRLIFGLYGPGN